MYENMTLFRMAGSSARHAGIRQAIVAQNVANADTPNYAARDIPSFAELATLPGGRPAVRATRGGHLFGQMTPASLAGAETRGGDVAPNGNSVSLEAEMLRSVEVQRAHNRALAIYRSAMNVLRASVSRS